MMAFLYFLEMLQQSLKVDSALPLSQFIGIAAEKQNGSNVYVYEQCHDEEILRFMLECQRVWYTLQSILK